MFKAHQTVMKTWHIVFVLDAVLCWFPGQKCWRRSKCWNTPLPLCLHFSGLLGVVTKTKECIVPFFISFHHFFLFICIVFSSGCCWFELWTCDLFLFVSVKGMNRSFKTNLHHFFSITFLMVTEFSTPLKTHWLQASRSVCSALQ